MKLGWWLLIVSFVVNAAASLVLGFQAWKIDALETKVAAERETNARLSAQVQAFHKLKAMTLRMGNEPLHLSGSMWVVFEEVK